MTRYFCDRCNAEIAREIDIQSVTFTLEASLAYEEPIIIQVHKELCCDCHSKAVNEFKKLINNM